jgi:hypothetical protein
VASESLDFVSPEAERFDGDDVIPIIATTTVAFIGRAERGPLNEPVPVKSFEAYRRVFGGHSPFSFLSHAVQHFFLHGGEAAIVVRVANGATRGLLELPAGAEVLRLQALHPGSREFLRVSVDYDRVERAPDRFNLVIQRLARPGSQLVDDQELYESLSMDPADSRFVVDALHDSELVRLVGPVPVQRPDATRAERPGDPIPYVGMSRPGTDGEDLTDYDIIGSNSEGTGLFALDGCQTLDFLCIPAPPGRDLGVTTFVAATRYCERRRALLIWDPPWSWMSVHGALLGVRGGEQASQNALSYFPRVRPRGEPMRYELGLPACGAIAGILARCDQSGVWHELPNADATLKANLAPLVTLDEREADLLNRSGVNVFVRLQPGLAVLRGNVSFAGLTAVTGLWQRLATSRLCSFVLKSVERHTRWVFTAQLFEEVPATLERQVWIFLSRLNQRGAFAGTQPDQAFFVRTSAQLRPDNDVALTLRIGFAPEKPNEFLCYDFRYHGLTMTTAVVPVLDAERHLG